MESLVENAKLHLKGWQTTLQGRSIIVKTAPVSPEAKWYSGTGNMKVSYDVACTYLEQLEEYVIYLRKAIEDRKSQVGEVEKSIVCVDEVLAELKKRKQPEAVAEAPDSPKISVVETPVLKKPAPNVPRR